MHIKCILNQILIFYLSCTLCIDKLKKIDRNEWWGRDNVTDIDESIRKFEIQWSNGMIADLKYRLRHRRPLQEPLKGITGFEYGMNSRTLDQIIEFWINKYNYTERVEYLNQFPQFKTNIQGLDVHFLWVKPKPLPSQINVIPILLLHGWPGLFREFYDVIPLLTKFRPGHDFVFEVVAPSLIGFGYSDAPDRLGFGTVEMAVVFRNLMRRLGYSKYYIQGGDWGGIIGSTICTIFPKEVRGFHTNMPVAISKQFIIKYIMGRFKKDIDPRFQDKIYPILDKLNFIYAEMGYFNEHTRKPDTFGIILNESPVSLAAYLLEFFAVATNIKNRMTKDGGLFQFDPKTLIDFIMIYWDTQSIGTSIRHYANCMRYQKSYTLFELNEVPTPVPVWALHLKNEPLFIPITLMNDKYKNIIGYTYLDDGGHFAALEIPYDTATDIWKAVKLFEMFWKRNRHF